MFHHVSIYFPNADLVLFLSRQTVKDAVIKGSPNTCIFVYIDLTHTDIVDSDVISLE